MTEQEYSGWDEGAVAADSGMVEEGSGGASYFKCVAGRNVVRALPAKPGGKALVVTYQHYVEIPGKPKVVFNCPRKMLKPPMPCPACSKSEKLLATKNPADRDQAFDLRPRLRVYINVLDRAHPESGALIYGFGKTVYDQLRALRDDPDVGDFFRPTGDGFDLIVDRKGTTKTDTEYHVRPSTKTLALGDLSILDTMADLSRMGEVPTYDAIVARLRGENTRGGHAPTTGGVRAPAAAPAAKPSDTWGLGGTDAVDAPDVGF